MAYINTKTLQYPVTEYEIKAVCWNTAFPHPFTPPDDYAWVFPSPQPEYNPLTSYVHEGAPLLADGMYYQTWVVAALEAAQVTENMVAAGNQLKNSIITEMQQRLNEFASTRGYDNVDSMSKYKDITNEEIAALPEEEQPLVLKFRAECRYLALATARTWARLYLLLAEVEQGARPMPTGLADFTPELPVLEWPV